MIRKVVFRIGGLYCIIVGIIVINLLQAAPGPRDQEIHGVGIGSYDRSAGIAYLSGRQLACVPVSQPAAFTSACTVTIAGKALTIFARHNQTTPLDHFDGSCEARYDGRVWECRLAWRHVHTPWFAYIDAPLDLSDAQIAILRQQYWIENLPEAIVMQFIQLSVLLSTSLAALGAALWFWPVWKNKLLVVGTASALSLLAFVGSGIGVLFLTGGFWD